MVPYVHYVFIETHPNAKTVEVTLSFIDYFPTDFSADAVRQYERIIDNLQVMSHGYRHHVIVVSLV